MQLPENVIAPQYALFEAIQYKPRNLKDPIIGVVCGLEYQGALMSLLEGADRYGWRYVIRPHHGLNTPLESLLGFHNFDAEERWEFELSKPETEVEEVA